MRFSELLPNLLSFGAALLELQRCWGQDTWHCEVSQRYIYAKNDHIGGFKDIFYFSALPTTWGNNPIWRLHIFQMGWFKHQLVIIEETRHKIGCFFLVTQNLLEIISPKNLNRKTYAKKTTHPRLTAITTGVLVDTWLAALHLYSQIWTMQLGCKFWDKKSLQMQAMFFWGLKLYWTDLLPDIFSVSLIDTIDSLQLTACPWKYGRLRDFRPSWWGPAWFFQAWAASVVLGRVIYIL